ncbi:hypothetical protein RGQ15_22325 [Paracoccus sp. MBLB3053]|uniref:Phage portal protein n=1 Tax=Paracoccus aurantius TaxID=3073814 RepID=A0ABU2HZ17_9RHOB|nr:hypothetical protein [Paracoccus sp. MBLB3053]MDS9470286.1 hypothetical protein [Paracoccus sp. MBLB3053]
MAKMPKGKEEKRRWLGGVIQNELARAENAADDNDRARRQAVAYYLCRPRGDEIENRSTAQSSDVRDMVNAVLAMLTPMLSTDSVVEFEPLSEQDEDGAQAESDVLNKLIVEDNQGAIEIQEAVKDALLMRNGAMKIWQEERLVSERLDVSGLAKDERLALAHRIEDADPGASAEIEGDHIRVKRFRSRFRTASVPIEMLCWSSGSGDLQERRFFAEAMDLSRSELLERGVRRELVEDLGTSGAEAKLDRLGSVDDMQGETEDQELISCHECYLMIDLDGDGISERWRILVAEEKEVLEQELVGLIPYAIGTGFINPHRLTGESLFDHLKQIQDSKTFFLRQAEDNTATMQNGKYVYDPARVNEEDVLNPIAGGGIRARDPQAVAALTIPDTVSGSLAMLTYQDKRRTEAGGASLDMMQADVQLAGETATGIERQYASREQMVSMMASNLGETLLRGLYTIAHAYLRTYAAEPFQVRVKGQFVQVDPRAWPERTRMNVTVGKTPGQRAHMQNVLGMHLQMQAQAMAAGMTNILASPQTLHATARAWLRMAGIDNPDAMLLDPSSPSAQQAAQAAQQQAQAAQQQQLQLIQAQLALESRKLDVQEAKNRGELAHKYFDTETQLAMKEAEIVGGAQIDLEKQAREAASQSRREADAAMREDARAERSADREDARAAAERDAA